MTPNTPSIRKKARTATEAKEDAIKFWEGQIEKQLEEPKPDIRSRPKKTDKELLEEYFVMPDQFVEMRMIPGGHEYCYRDYPGWEARKKEIERELGPEKILAERVRRTEEAVKELQNQQVPALPKIAITSLVCGVIGTALYLSLTSRPVIEFLFGK